MLNVMEAVGRAIGAAPKRRRHVRRRSVAREQYEVDVDGRTYVAVDRDPEGISDQAIYDVYLRGRFVGTVRRHESNPQWYYRLGRSHRWHKGPKKDVRGLQAAVRALVRHER